MSKRRKLKKMRYAKWGDFTEPARCICKGVIGNSKYSYNYAIVNTCGRHPCAYIQVPEDMVNIAFELLPVHGGCSYEDNHYPTSKIVSEGYKWIGWDYGHLCDYTPPMDKNHKYSEQYLNRPRHTTEEVYNDIIKAVKELRYINQAREDFYFEINTNKINDEDADDYWGDMLERFINLKAAVVSQPVTKWSKLWLKSLSSVGFNTPKQQVKEINYVIDIINMAKSGELKITSKC